MILFLFNICGQSVKYGKIKKIHGLMVKFKILMHNNVNSLWLTNIECWYKVFHS